MKIVVAARCYNEIHNVERFLKGYSFADEIVISDGGSTDGSIEALQGRDKVTLLHFGERIEWKGGYWNPDAPHMNFVLDHAKSLKPDWLIFDDFDCVPNANLREQARFLLENNLSYPQVNVFRLYLWGDYQYFPAMNNYFNPDYTSLWAWRPDVLNIYADPSQLHGTILGVSGNNLKVETPLCLLHKSWRSETVQFKMDRYSAVGIAMTHPLQSSGELLPLPEWAHE